jgi:glyoxylase-like metal-dependent hydrolase (beta-lactamase superfamily II)
MQDQNTSLAAPGSDVTAGPPESRLTRLSPLLRRVIANNAGPFTYTGTCSYIVGEGRVAIVDPGPAGHDEHVAALLEAVRGETVSHIVVTHTHRDHSPAARALKAQTGAPIVGCGPHRPARPRADGLQDGLDSGGDREHAPDQLMRDGDTVAGPGWTLKAVATPGHTANHLAFALAEDGALLSGDQVMAWSTTVIAPPDGSMADYMASLRHLLTLEHAIYWPGHGGPVREPARYVRGLIAHRKQRERLILEAVKAGAQSVAAIVEQAYPAIAAKLVGAASLSTLAHLEWLVEQGLVASEDGEVSMKALYRPV